MFDFLPKLKHPVVNELCIADLDIHEDLIAYLLALPREELINDLELLLDCFLKDQDKFFENMLNEGEDSDLLIHAMIFFAEHSAVEALPTILRIMSLDEDAINYWLGDFYGIDWTLLLIHIAKDDLEKYFQFIKSPNVFWLNRSVAVESLEQLVVYYPEKREEINDRIEDLIKYLLEVKPADKSYDPLAFTFMMLTIGSFKGLDFKETAIELNRQKKYDADFTEPFEDFLSSLESPLPFEPKKKKKKTIYEFYEFYVSRYVNHEESEIDDLTKEAIDEMIAQNLFEGLKLPELRHSELKSLYKYDFDIEEEVVNSMLRLPRETLISDLELILNDYATKAPLMETEDELTLPFWVPHHSLFFLAEL